MASASLLDGGSIAIMVSNCSAWFWIMSRSAGAVVEAARVPTPRRSARVIWMLAMDSRRHSGSEQALPNRSAIRFCTEGLPR